MIGLFSFELIYRKIIELKNAVTNNGFLGSLELSREPIALWMGNQLQGPTKNQLGRDYDLTAVGLTRSAAGMFGEGVSHANGGYLGINDSRFYPQNSDWTVCGWFTDSGGTVMSVWNTSGNNRGWILQNASTGLITYSTTGSDFSNEDPGFTGITANNQGFYFCCVDYNRTTDAMSVRINNQTYTFTVDLNNATADLVIGGRADGDGAYTGTWNQVAYFDGLLTTDDKDALYANGNGADLRNVYPLKKAADATAVINAISATGATLTSAEQNAICYRFHETERQRFLANFRAYYGILGSSRAAHQINWIAPGTNNMTWNGGFIHTNNRVVGDKALGTYGEVPIAPSNLLQNNVGIAYFMLTLDSSPAALAYPFGVETNAGYRFSDLVQSGGAKLWHLNVNSTDSGLNHSIGYSSIHRRANNTTQARVETTTNDASTLSTTPRSDNIYVLARNNEGGDVFRSGDTLASFAVFDRYLTETDDTINRNIEIETHKRADKLLFYPTVGAWLGNTDPGLNIDSSGNGRDLTQVGTVTSVAGTWGQAMSFAGTGRLGRTDTAFQPAAAPWSVVAWLTEGAESLSIWRTSGNQRGWRILSAANGSIEYSTNGSGFTNILPALGETVNANGLFFFLLAYNPVTDFFLIRCNNSIHTETISIFNSSAQFSLGGRDGGSGAFTGTIDQCVFLPYFPTLDEQDLFYNNGEGLDLANYYFG